MPFCTEKKSRRGGDFQWHPRSRKQRQIRTRIQSMKNYNLTSFLRKICNPPKPRTHPKNNPLRPPHLPDAHVINGNTLLIFHPPPFPSTRTPPSPVELEILYRQKMREAYGDNVSCVFVRSFWCCLQYQAAGDIGCRDQGHQCVCGLCFEGDTITMLDGKGLWRMSSKKLCGRCGRSSHA